jgi:hypothetical protein
VTQTAAMLMFAICHGVRPWSVRIAGNSGATANQAKNHTKNAIHVKWNARSGMLRKRTRQTVAEPFATQVRVNRIAPRAARMSARIEGRKLWRAYERSAES